METTKNMDVDADADVGVDRCTMGAARKELDTPSGMSAVSLKTIRSNSTLMSDADSLGTTTSYDENDDGVRSDASEQTEATYVSRALVCTNVGTVGAPVLQSFVETAESRRELEQMLETFDREEEEEKASASTVRANKNKNIAQQIHDNPDGSGDYPFMRDLENVSDNDNDDDTRNASKTTNKRSRGSKKGGATRRNGNGNGNGKPKGKKSRNFATEDGTDELDNSEYAPVSRAVHVAPVDYAASTKDLFREFCEKVYLSDTIGAKVHLTSLVVGWLAAPGNTFDIHTDPVTHDKIIVGTVKKYTTKWFTSNRTPLCLLTLHSIIHRRLDTSIARGFPGPVSSKYHAIRAGKLPEAAQFILVRHSATQIAHKYNIANVCDVEQLMDYFNTVVIDLAKIYTGHTPTLHEFRNFCLQLSRIETWNISMHT